LSSVISAGRGGTTPIERLSAADLSMVWPEDFGWPQDIGAIAVVDGSSLLDATGRFRGGSGSGHDLTRDILGISGV
jgi:hypothetical protein